MNKLFSLVAFIIIVFFTYGFYLSQFQLSYVNPTIQKDSRFYTYQLNQNIHSIMSLGSGTMNEIADDAEKIQNDFVMLTDLDQRLDLDYDRYLDRVGVLVATKYMTEFGRFIQYSPKEKQTQKLYSEFVGIFAGKTQKNLIVQAHPLESKYDENFLRSKNLDGIEVINLKKMTQSSWKGSLVSTIWSLLFYPFNPKLSLIRLFNEPSEEMALFDRISMTKNFSMFLGSEASARAIPFADWLIRFPSYERTLGIASQHLVLNSELTGEIKEDSQKILDSLKTGRFFLAFDALGSPQGFEAYLQADNSDLVSTMGDTVSFKPNLKLHFSFPEPNMFYEVILFKDGERIDHFNTFSGYFLIKEPGVYRVQVRISARLPLPDANKWIGWIYTNNYYVK